MPVTSKQLQEILAPYDLEKRKIITDKFNALSGAEKNRLARTSVDVVTQVIAQIVGPPPPPDTSAAADVTGTLPVAVPIEPPSFDPERGVEDVVGTGTGSFIRAALSATPTLEGKIRIIQRHQLVPAFGTEGQLILQDPEDPNVRIAINSNDTTLGDIASIVPETLRTLLETGTDVQMMRSQGALTGAGLTGIKSFLARTAVTGGAGLFGGLFLNALSAAGGAQDHLSRDERLEVMLRRGIGDAATNAGMFVGSELAGRLMRGSTQAGLHRGVDTTPNKQELTRLANAMDATGVPGTELFRGRTGISRMLTLFGKASDRFNKFRTSLQGIIDKKANKAWESLTKGSAITPGKANLAPLTTPSEFLEKDAVDALTGRAKALSLLQGGKVTKKAFDDYSKRMSSSFKEIFEEIGAFVGDVKGRTPRSIAMIDQLLNRFRGNKDITRLLKEYRKDFISKRPASATINAAGDPIVGSARVPKDLTYQQMKTLRTQLGDTIAWGKVKDRSEDYATKQLYESLTEDMFDLARSVDPRTVPMIEKASAEFAEHMDFMGNPLLHQIKGTREASRLIDPIFRSPENVQTFKRVVSNPRERIDVGLAHLREDMGIVWGDKIQDINVSKARKAIRNMKKGGVEGEGSVWDEFFNDENGILDTAAGEQLEAFLTAVDIEQRALAARQTFARDLLRTDSLEDISVIRRVNKFRDNLNDFIRDNPELLSHEDIGLLRQVANDTEAMSATNTLRRSLAEKLRSSGDPKVSGIHTVDPAKFRGTIKKFIKELPEEQRNALKFKTDEAIDLDRFYRKLLSPEEMESLVEADVAASVGEQVDDLTRSASIGELLSFGQEPIVKLPIGPMQKQTAQAGLIRRFLSAPAGRIIAPSTFAEKGTVTGLPPIISNFLSRGMKGTLRNPDQRQLEFTIRQLLRAGQLSSKATEEPFLNLEQEQRSLIP